MKLKFYFSPYILFVINALAFSACDLVNPPEDIPSYIHIGKYTLTTNEANQGTNSNKITDVWINAGNTFVGGFELPTTVPVLEKGMKTVVLSAGVLESGVSTTRVPYPFYEPYKLELELKEAHIDTIVPQWKYSDETRFPWLENFESSNISVETTNRSTSGFRITNSSDSAFEGKSALSAIIDDNHKVFECQTKSAYRLPRGKAVWVELNYKNDVPIEVGVIAMGADGNTNIFTGGMNPSANWNKIYINITNTVSYVDGSKVFKIYINAFQKDAGTSGKILIDNLKLLYLE